MSSIAINGFTLTHQALHATQETGISPIERLVLGTLAGFCNFLSECWPSNSTLADRTGLHERTVRRQLESLQAKGLIERHSRGQGRAMLTRLLITPQGRTTDTPPTTTDTVPPYEPTRNLLQTPNTAHEPPQQQATAPAAMPLLFVSELPEQPEQPTPALPDLEHPPITSICHTEATETPYSASNEADPAYPTTEPVAPVVEADPVEKAWAEVDPQVLLDLMEIRKFKKKAPKPTKTEVKHWYSIALESGFTLAQIVYVMVLRGWGSGIADASWLQNVPRPQMTATGTPATPAAPALWTPDPNHIPASPSTVAKMKEQIAAMKQRWREEPLKARPMRQ